MAKRGRKSDLSRDHDMCCMFRDGETLAEVSEHYGLTKERVRQILARNGLSRKDGGKAIQVGRAKKEAAINLQASREKRAMKRYGVSWDEYINFKEHIGATSLERFRHVRHGAINGAGNYNKTTFELSLAEYVDIWESSGHKVNQEGFCFSRKNPKKGFTKDNVHIISKFEKSQKAGVEYGFRAHPENIKKDVDKND